MPVQQDKITACRIISIVSIPLRINPVVHVLEMEHAVDEMHDVIRAFPYVIFLRWPSWDFSFRNYLPQIIIFDNSRGNTTHIPDMVIFPASSRWCFCREAVILIGVISIIRYYSSYF